MKYHTISVGSVVIGLAISLMGCNDGVFVSELKASATELQMNGEGDSSVVKLNKTSDWEIVSVDSPDAPANEPFYGKIYDENGNLLWNDNVSFFQQYMKGNGKMVYRGTYNGFTIKRSQGSRLEIFVDENLADKDFKFTVWVADDYKSIPINITQSPSAGYTFDHITYTLVSGSYATTLENSKTPVTLNNGGDAPITIGLPIFSDEHRIFSFSSEDPKAFAYLKTNEQVTIPATVKNGQLQFLTEKMYYKSSEQKVSLPFQNVYKNIVIQKGRTEVTRILEYESFEAKYTLYVRNKKTREMKSVQGTFHSEIPTGTYYVILKR